MVRPFHGRGDLLGGNWRVRAVLFFERWHWTPDTVESLLISEFDFYYETIKNLIQRERDAITKASGGK